MKNRYYIRSHLTERQFREVVRLFCLDVCALTTASILHLNKNTTNAIFQKLRVRLVQLSLEESAPFTGEIEVDESYFGSRRIRGKRGRGAKSKIPVVGLLKRGGSVYVKIVEDCSKASLQPIIRGQVVSSSTLYTDGWSGYDGLILDGYKHHRVHHHENEFARGKNHINGIESFWSFAKLRMSKKRGILRKNFLSHLLECQWRWNHRHQNSFQILIQNLVDFPLN